MAHSQRTHSGQTTSLTLLRAAKDLHSRPAWERLVKQYSPRVLAACWRANVEKSDVPDVCNEVWMAVVRNIGAFEHSGKQKGQFRAWLNQITRSKVADYFRAKQGHSSNVPNNLLDSHAWDDERPNESSEATLQHSAEIVAEIKRKFGGEAQQIFFSLVVEGQSAATVAKQFGKQPGTIYGIKSRIIKWLKNRKSDQ